MAAKASSEKNVLKMLNDSVIRLDVEHVRELLESKPKLNTNFGGRLISYIMYHALDKEFDDYVLTMTTMLVKAGAKLNMRGTNEYKRYKQDPKHYEFLHLISSRANKKEFLELAILMMDHGADVMATNENGSTPLHIAAEIGSVALAEELIKRGADVEVTDHDNCNAIHVAINGILDGITKTDVMLPLLIKAGNADEETIKRRGILAFRHSMFEFGNLTEPMRVLFDLGIPVDSLDNVCDNLDQFYWPGHVCQPLNYAAHWQRLGTVEFLASRGADINKHSKCGRPPITVAFLRDNPITIQCILRLGADVNNCNKDDGLYPIHTVVAYSVDYPTPSYIQVLLNLGADINVTEKEGKTPLALLVKEAKFGASHKTIIRHLAFLTSNGKEVNDMDLQIIQNRRKLKDCYERCLIELDKMKATLIYDVSVFDLLAKSDRAVSLFLRSKDFLNSYSKIKGSFHSKFPEYFVQLKNKIELVKSIRTTIDKHRNALEEAIFQCLPEILLDKIIDYALEGDIKKLILEFHLTVYRNSLEKAGYLGFSNKHDETNEYDL